jgi:hypothetical protein
VSHLKEGPRLPLIIGVVLVLFAGCGWSLTTTEGFEVTVDNRLGVPATLQISDWGPPAAGGPALIAAPVVVPPGEHLVRLPDPRDEWSLSVRGQDGFFDGSELREWAAQLERGDLALFRLIIEPTGMSAETSR